VRALLHEPERAAALGARARAFALDRFGVDRFLADWDALLEQTRERVSARSGQRAAAAAPR
jgi:hypothetical protein